MINSKSKIMLKMYLRTVVLNAFSDNLFTTLEWSQLVFAPVHEAQGLIPTLCKAGVHTPITPALRRESQEDQKPKVILSYKTSLRPAWAT